MTDTPNGDGEAGAKREGERRVRLEVLVEHAPRRRCWGTTGAQEMKTPGTRTAQKPGSPRRLNETRRPKGERSGRVEVEPRQAARNGKLRAPGIERSPSTGSPSCKAKRAETRTRLDRAATRLPRGVSDD